MATDDEFRALLDSALGASDPLSIPGVRDAIRKGNAQGSRAQCLAPEAETQSRADPSAPDDGRPVVRISVDLPRTVNEAERVLREDRSSGVYVRSGGLVAVIRDGARKVVGLARATGAPVIQPIPNARLLELLCRVAHFERAGQAPGEWVRCQPTARIVETLAARGEWDLPPIEAVIESPTLRPDGTVLDVAGYDPGTATLFDPGSAKFPPVPTTPTLDDARAAVDLILDVLADFPFVSGADKAAVVAALLTVVGRSAIRGPVPLFAIRATAPGSGKGLLAAVISTVATGRNPAVLTHSNEPEETRKRLLAIAMEGASIVLLDNVEGALGSSHLAAALTSEEVQDRVLGFNRTARAPWRAVILTTGNNTSFKGDLGRRVVPIDLDPRCENPEERTGFRHPDLIAHVRERRGELVAAALTILRAHVCADRPAHGCPRLGSFRGMGRRNPGAARLGRARRSGRHSDLGCGKKGDDDRERIEALFAAWSEAFGSNHRTLADAIAADDKGKATFPAVRDALSAFDTKGTPDKPNPRSIAAGVGRILRRVIDGRRLEKADEKGHGGRALYRLATMDDVEPGRIGRIGEVSSSFRARGSSS